MEYDADDAVMFGAFRPPTQAEPRPSETRKGWPPPPKPVPPLPTYIGGAAGTPRTLAKAGLRAPRDVGEVSGYSPREIHCIGPVPPGLAASELVSKFSEVVAAVADIDTRRVRVMAIGMDEHGDRTVTFRIRPGVNPDSTTAWMALENAARIPGGMPRPFERAKVIPRPDRPQP